MPQSPIRIGIDVDESVRRSRIRKLCDVCLCAGRDRAAVVDPRLPHVEFASILRLQRDYLRITLRPYNIEIIRLQLRIGAFHALRIKEEVRQHHPPGLLQRGGKLIVLIA